MGFRSLKESLDTTTAGSRLIFHVFGALAEFEREIIRERTMAGLHAGGHEIAREVEHQLLHDLPTSASP